MRDRVRGVGGRHEDEVHRPVELDVRGDVDEAAVAHLRRVERRERAVRDVDVAAEMALERRMARAQRLGEARDDDPIGQLGDRRQPGSELAVHEDQRGPLRVAEDEGVEVLPGHSRRTGGGGLPLALDDRLHRSETPLLVARRRESALLERVRRGPPDRFEPQRPVGHGEPASLLERLHVDARHFANASAAASTHS